VRPALYFVCHGISTLEEDNDGLLLVENPALSALFAVWPQIKLKPQERKKERGNCSIKCLTTAKNKLQIRIAKL
jgi:hypothetical protein